MLGWLDKNAPESLHNYFDTAIHSGMRPEELIALKWQDIDFDGGALLVVRSRSGGELKSTKTNRSRLIEMNRPLRLALERQRNLSGVQDWVFLNPTTKRAWNSEKSQRENYWKPALKACGIRPRFAYQTRHTFASLSLSAGANPMWLAVQMGHSSTKMLFERYGKWIDSPGRATEHSKIESMFENRGNVPELSQKGVSKNESV